MGTKEDRLNSRNRFSCRTSSKSKSSSSSSKQEATEKNNNSSSRSTAEFVCPFAFVHPQTNPSANLLDLYALVQIW